MYNKLKRIVAYISLILVASGCANPKMTTGNLHEAVKAEQHGEICCHQYAIKAGKDSLFKASLLLNAMGKSQQIHKEFFIDLLKDHDTYVTDSSIVSKYETDSTIINLYRLLADSQYEFYNLYPEFVEVAQKEGSRKVRKGLELVMSASENQLKIIQTLIDSISKTGSDDFLSNSWYVCQECGNIEPGEAKPKEKCQICKSQQFTAYKL